MTNYAAQDFLSLLLKAWIIIHAHSQRVARASHNRNRVTREGIASTRSKNLSVQVTINSAKI